MILKMAANEKVYLYDYGQVGAGKIIEFIPHGKRSVTFPASQRTEVGDGSRFAAIHLRFGN